MHFQPWSLSHRVLAGAVLAGCMALASAPQMRADDNDCQRRIARADHKLHEAVEHRGPQSRQAQHARAELREARERCWNSNRRWWSEHDHKWHTERDWDDHDHDRDDRH